MSFWYPNILTIGEPGSGKSVSAAQVALRFPGAVVIFEWHEHSTAELVLMNNTGDVLYDKLSDLDHGLRYGLLRASAHPEQRKRRQENLRRISFITEVLMRRRGDNIASAPLMEEWLTAALTSFLYQDPPKPPSMLPFLFQPETDGFRAMQLGCMLPEIRQKFEVYAKLPPRGRRSESGSTVRLLNGVFRSESFAIRCLPGLDLAAHLRRGGTLILERGGEDEDVSRTIMGGVSMLVTEVCEARPRPSPPVLAIFEECTNAGTAGKFEEKKAGENRKHGLFRLFSCQWPNFPGGDEGYLQNCGRKEVFRTGDYGLVRKFAAIAAPGFSSLPDESHAAKVQRIADAVTTFQPGQRLVTDRNGSSIEQVPLLENPWPNWPGLREAKLQERLRCIYSRPEYQKTGPGDFSSGSPAATPPPDKSPDSDSPAKRLRRRGKRRAGGSPSSGDGSASA